VLTKFVSRGVPFQFTIVAELKPEPLTVSMNAGLPAGVLLGEIEEIIPGDGLEPGEPEPEEEPPPDDDPALDEDAELDGEPEPADKAHPAALRHPIRSVPARINR
jgi:hypothetical protein